MSLFNYSERNPIGELICFYLIKAYSYMDQSDKPFIARPASLEDDEWKELISFAPAVRARCLSTVSPGTYCNFRRLLIRSEFLSMLKINDREITCTDVKIPITPDPFKDLIVPTHLAESFIHYMSNGGRCWVYFEFFYFDLFI